MHNLYTNTRHPFPLAHLRHLLDASRDDITSPDERESMPTVFFCIAYCSLDALKNIDDDDDENNGDTYFTSRNDRKRQTVFVRNVVNDDQAHKRRARQMTKIGRDLTAAMCWLRELWNCGVNI